MGLLIERRGTPMAMPECVKCGKSGEGVLFSIFSKYGFGTYCVECEKDVDNDNTN